MVQWLPCLTINLCLGSHSAAHLLVFIFPFRQVDLGKVNCDNPDVALTLCPGVMGSLPPQAQGLMVCI